MEGFWTDEHLLVFQLPIGKLSLLCLIVAVNWSSGHCDISCREDPTWDEDQTPMYVLWSECALCQG